MLFFIITIIALIWQSLAIVVPADAWHQIKSYKTANDTLDEIDNEIRINQVSCLTRFLRQNLPSTRVPIIIPANRISRNSEFFLRNLQLELSVFIVREKFPSSRNYNGSLNVVLLLDDKSQANNVTENLVYICSTKCVYVAIVTRIYREMKNFMKDADELVDLLWNRRIANVAIFAIVENSVQLAKSGAFKRKVLREPASPKFFGDCQKTNGWDTSKETIFAPLSLNGSLAKVAFFVADPYAFVDNKSVKGIEVDLLNAVSEKLGLTLIRDEIPWTSTTDDLAEIHKKLNSNQSFDLVLGGLQWAPTWDIDYTFPYKVGKIVWLIPVEPNLSLEGLIAPFESNVWYAVVVVLIVTIFLKSLFLKDISFLDVFALIIGTSTPEQPTRLSSRIQYLSWSIFGYVLSQSYLASLAGVLVDEANEQIQTMEELVADGIQYGGTRRFRELFALSNSEDDSDTDDLSNSDIIQTIYNNFLVLKYEKYVLHLHDLISGNNKEMALVALLNFSTSDDNFDNAKVQQLREPLADYPLGFAVWRGLPYLDELEQKILILTESGFIKFWEGRYVIDDDDDFNYDESMTVLGLAQLAPGFLLLVIGTLVGIVALVVEIMLDGFRKRKQIKARVKLMALKWRKKTERNRMGKTIGKMKMSVKKNEKTDSNRRKTRAEQIHRKKFKNRLQFV